MELFKEYPYYKGNPHLSYGFSESRPPPSEPTKYSLDFVHEEYSQYLQENGIQPSETWLQSRYFNRFNVYSAQLNNHDDEQQSKRFKSDVPSREDILKSEKQRVMNAKWPHVCPLDSRMIVIGPNNTRVTEISMTYYSFRSVSTFHVEHMVNQVFPAQYLYQFLAQHQLDEKNILELLDRNKINDLVYLFTTFSKMSVGEVLEIIEHWCMAILEAKRRIG